jgi:hypothetical protein
MRAGDHALCARVALSSGVSRAALRRSETACAERGKGKRPAFRGADEGGPRCMSWRGSALKAGRPPDRPSQADPGAEPGDRRSRRGRGARAARFRPRPRRRKTAPLHTFRGLLPAGGVCAAGPRLPPGGKEVPSEEAPQQSSMELARGGSCEGGRENESFEELLGRTRKQVTRIFAESAPGAADRLIELERLSRGRIPPREVRRL